MLLGFEHDYCSTCSRVVDNLKMPVEEDAEGDEEEAMLEYHRRQGEFELKAVAQARLDAKCALCSKETFRAIPGDGRCCECYSNDRRSPSLSEAFLKEALLHDAKVPSAQKVGVSEEAAKRISDYRTVEETQPGKVSAANPIVGLPPIAEPTLTEQTVQMARSLALMALSAAVKTVRECSIELEEHEYVDACESAVVASKLVEIAERADSLADKILVG